jgi:DNA polymerase III subunit delta'
MSRADRDEDDAPPWPHPRETSVLFGHAEVERALLEAYRGGRLPHAWLIGGPAGIGKATLAFRFARFLLAHPDPRAAEVRGATSLAVDPGHPVARRMAVQAQGDLLVLERVVNENTGKLYTVIRVDDVRRTVSFFGSTAGQGGWRITIVDTADDLLREGANALLKVLEEPPPRSLFLVVSHAPGRLLPTIRSRTRRLDLRSLAEADVARAAASALGRQADDAELRQAATLADGSVARALGLLSGPGLKLRQQVDALLAALPKTDPKALHALGDALGDDEAFGAFLDGVRDWLEARVRSQPQQTPRLARFAEAWDKINTAASDVDEFNLERRPMMFSVFGVLAEAARA